MTRRSGLRLLGSPEGVICVLHRCDEGKSVIDVAYGHADKLASQPSGSRDETLIDPDWFETPEMRRILDARDISSLYRELKGHGLSNRRIAALTGQSQSEISEILKGRQVRDVTVLERIADGLGIPRGYLRLASAEREQSAYAGCDGEAEQEVDEEMRRRVLMASTSLAALGKVIEGELARLGLPTGEPLPKRLEMVHVHTVQVVTQRLVALVRQFGGQAGLFAAAVARYTQWLKVPADEEVKARLGAALAELHTDAGWACHDSGLDGTGYFTRALELADEAGDAYGIANAAWHAGATLVRSGHPNDALKCFQLGGFLLNGFQPGKAKPATLHPDDPRVPYLAARLNLNSATAFALMKRPDQTKRALAKIHDGGAPRDIDERAGIERSTAAILLDLHQLDAAEPFAASAVRNYTEVRRLGRILAEVTLAEVHVRAGEPRGLALAHHAINEVRTLQSVRVRQERLLPLFAALQARPGSEARELAQLARQVAATRA